jgi:hypothetical protein
VEHQGELAALCEALPLVNHARKQLLAFSRKTDFRPATIYAFARQTVESFLLSNPDCLCPPGADLFVDLVASVWISEGTSGGSLIREAFGSRFPPLYSKGRAARLHGRTCWDLMPLLPPPRLLPPTHNRRRVQPTS